MTVVRWRPLREMNSLQREMNRMFDSFFDDSNQESASTDWHPLVDIKETSDMVSVYAELPGIKKEDINISIRDNVLHISGEKQRDEIENDANYHRMERAYGSFSRSMTLPAKVQVDKIKAVFKDGILQMDLPKAEDEKPHLIEIN